MKRSHLFLGLCLVVLVAGMFLLSRRKLSPLQGHWVRADVTLCSVTYPAEVEFLRDGSYVAQGFSPWWRGGRYAYVENRVRLETTDGPALYRIHLTHDEVMFTNSAGCTVTYRRSR